jgi:hypothetical protein
MTVGYADLAKTQFKADDPVYVQAQKRYITAQTDNTKWLSMLEGAIRQGNVKDLAADDSFQQLGDKAAQSTGEFVRFVDEHTSQSKGTFSWIGDAIDAGIKLWKEIKGEITSGREAIGKQLESDASWPLWSAIGAAGSKSDTSGVEGTKPKPTK